jgi:Berberine and berberine like
MYYELEATGEAMPASYVSVTSPETLRLDKIYGAEWENLLELKTKLDPKGVFKNAVPGIGFSHANGY